MPPSPPPSSPPFLQADWIYTCWQMKLCLPPPPPPSPACLPPFLQADWMYTCWQAGLQPFGIYSYSQLYMLIWGSQVISVPVGTDAVFYTQVRGEGRTTTQP